MFKIHVQKNNKKKFSMREHIFRIKNNSGQTVGVMVRIEAVSRRRNSGENSWDIFYFGSPPEGCSWRIDWEDPGYYAEYQPRPCYDRVGEISRYGGSQAILRLAHRVETPMGEEISIEEISIEGVTLKNALPNEKKRAAQAALQAIQEGFGPHGYIKNSNELEKWAREILEKKGKEEEEEIVEIFRK